MRLFCLSDSKKMTMASPSYESLLFSHVCNKEPVTASRAHQANRLPLSRPRDFISVLTKERDCSVSCNASENPGTLPTSLENSPTLLKGQALSQAKSSSPGTASVDSQSAQPEYRRQSASDMTLNCGVNEIMKYSGSCSEGKDEVFTDMEKTGKRDG